MSKAHQLIADLGFDVDFESPALPQFANIINDLKNQIPSPEKYLLLIRSTQGFATGQDYQNYCHQVQKVIGELGDE